MVLDHQFTRDEALPANGEDHARGAVEVRYGRPLTDAEWTRVKERLMALCRIVDDWHTTTQRPGSAPVEAEEK